MQAVDPHAALALFADDPRYKQVRAQMHPSIGGALAIPSDTDDALVCMATLAAIISHRELLLAGPDTCNHVARIKAIADTVGHDASRHFITTARGVGTWMEFTARVPA